MALAAAPIALAHEERGRGRPLVLVHGWAMSSRALGDLAGALARTHRTLALDLRGHGRSAAPETGYAVEDHAGDLVAFFERLELDGAVLAGWSLGAQVALEALPALAGRVRALVLLSGTPRFTAGEGWPHGLPEASVRALAARLERRPEAAVRRFFEGMFAPGELREAERAALAERVLGGPAPAPRAARAGLDAFLRADQRPRLGEVRVPALLLHGGADPICLPGAARAAAAAIPGAVLHELPGLGHAPHLSRPAAVAAEVAGFLRGVDAA
jgi:pimeloyl-[acyl-carrier protein] methyl ester esterase